MDARLKLKKAKIQLLIQNPFFSTLVLSMKEEADPSLPFVMATDGIRLVYNPQELEKLSLEEIIGILVHEALHVALLHPIRRQNRDPRLWNVACDYVVNPIVIQSKFVLPKDALYDKKYHKKYAEEVYDDLLRKQQSSSSSSNSPSQSASSTTSTSASASCSQNQSSSQPTSQQSPLPQNSSSSQQLNAPSDPSKMGGVIDPPSHVNLRELEQQLKQKIASALQVAKREGKVPAGLEEEVERLLYPKLPWSDILRRFIYSSVKDDYSYLKPSRKFLYRKLVFPSLYSPSVETVVIAIDTSGSISSDELKAFTNEINSIIQQQNIKKVVVVQCDADIQDIKEVTPPEMVESLRFKGRGGTDYRPVFEYVSKRTDLDVACLIYLTDLECSSYPSTPPPYPVLWVCTQKNYTPPPFGEVLVLE